MLFKERSLVKFGINGFEISPVAFWIGKETSAENWLEAPDLGMLSTSRIVAGKLQRYG